MAASTDVLPTGSAGGRSGFMVGDDTCDDNTSLVHLDDANILDNLSRRFERDKIYTYTANVLHAVNPYKELADLYSPARMWEYRNRPAGDLLPPHAFEIADKAFRQLMATGRCQALVISGESGAGKTETAKLTMRYLASVSGMAEEQSAHLQDKILNASPILESFGNASTLRNRNSSRFGKYNEMHFNEMGLLVGAGIKTFLLETSRVVTLSDAEENYHVFYEMLAGLETERLDELMLVQKWPYKLLNAKHLRRDRERVEETWEPSELERRSKKFGELQEALIAVGATPKEQSDVWDVVASLIHLGEVEFCDALGEDGETSPSGEEASPQPLTSPAYSTMSGQATPGGFTPNGQFEGSPVNVQNRDNLGQAADLLGLSVWSVQEVLQRRKLRVRSQDVDVLRTKAQAQQTLLSLIKVLYQRLFDKIVDIMNKQQQSPASSSGAGGTRHIGTLDIYGFECLDSNSFEQLCINLANERLQQFFIEEVLEAEQTLYDQECLNIEPFELPDSKPVVSRIQDMLTVLDEHSLRAHRGLGRNDPDQQFCEHVHRNQVQETNSAVMSLRLKASRNGNSLGRNDGFQIRHYAGHVPYVTRGWVDKNTDQRMPEVETLLADSAKSLVQDMARPVDTKAGEKHHSVTKKFMANCDELLDTLKSCSVLYIRCFNPNMSMEPGVFDKKYVLDQVVYSGTVELVKIMHHGFPHRMSLQELRKRFRGLLPQDMVENYSPHHFVQALMLAFQIEERQWTVGVTQLFFKAGQLRVLEHLRNAGSTASKEMITRIRALFARKKVRACCAAIQFVNWLPAYVKRRRQDRFLEKLRKAVFVFVRLHRWLNRAKVGLHGTAETSQMSRLDLAQHALGLTYRVPVAERSRGVPYTGREQLFMALNLFEKGDMTQPLYTGLCESVMYFNGSELITAKLSSTALQRSPGQARLGRSLSDIRKVEMFTTGLAVPVPVTLPVPNIRHPRKEEESLQPAKERIACMCQHRKDQQIFASCNGTNQGLVWRWLGTDSHDHGKAAMQPLGRFQLPDTVQILQVCFLSDVPESIDTRNGYCVALLCAEKNRHWLNVIVLAVYPAFAGYRIAMYRAIGVESPLFLEDQEVEVCFFTTSHTDRVFIIGGRGMLQFVGIQEEHEEPPKLVLIQDCAMAFQDICRSTMVSCLAPPPCSSTVFDWVVVGDMNGKLYGFGFDVEPGGKITMNEHTAGRYRTNTHDDEVPIFCLVSSFRVGAEEHAKKMQCMPPILFYTDVVKSRPVDKGFISLGENGRLLSWQHSDGMGWQSTEEAHLCPNSSGSESVGGHRFVAAHASRLVPEVLVIVDKHAKMFYLFDIDKKTIEGVHSYS
eukprot:TRINITY_DN14280_c0_g1_i4.p1 TRINITY_DN14280_c0_g1~~TRINITY_DN14280_c0_g1_i4.p1  ORF type:complete len:1337 (+),score=240.95 TRINITY_DN14280_c0_g1_i4:2-4012(+)